jgi:peroxiredoxin Q/BCP
LTIDLLADPQATLLNALAVGQKEFGGNMYWNRSTFVIDPKGTVRKVYTDVKPDGHEQMLLKDIKELQATAVAH